MIQRAAVLVAVLTLASCITEGDVETSKHEDRKSPVEQVHSSIEQRIERIKLQRGKELLAALQDLIALRDLARGPIIAALPAADVRTQAALIYVLGYIGGPESQKAVLPYAKSTDASIRYEAAAALVQLGDWSGIPVLIEFMQSEDRRMRYKSFQVLREKTAQELGYDFNAPETERIAAVTRWKSWWAERRDEIIFGKNG